MTVFALPPYRHFFRFSRGRESYHQNGRSCDKLSTVSSGHFDRSSENAFLLVYASCGCNLGVEQILGLRNSINPSTKIILLEGRAKTGHKIRKGSYLHCLKYN